MSSWVNAFADEPPLRDADDHTPYDVDRRDHHAGERITANELASTVHGTVKIRLVLHLPAAGTSLLLGDESVVQLRVDRKLLSRHAV